MKKLMIALSALASAVALAETGDASSDAEDPIGIETSDAAAKNAAPHWTPLEINLASPVLSLPWRDRDVFGLKLNLVYGSAAKVRGLDLGLVSRNVGETYGIQADAFDWCLERVAGVQLGAVGCVDYKGFAGIQLAGVAVNDLAPSTGVLLAPLTFTTGFTGLEAGLLNWEFAAFDGFQLGLVNEIAATGRAFQLGMVNWNRRSISGAQIGLLNCVEGEAEGLQLGLFNGADALTGLQVGLFNFNAAAPMPLMVVANAKF